MSPPSNNVTLAVSAPSSATRASFPTQNDRERSRNAKAQARHRAKRKAYVEQLEQTVTRLQAAMSLANDDMGPLNRIRELEEENARLRQDIIELRRELEDRSAQFLRPDIGRRTSDFTPNDSYRGDANGAAATGWGEFEYKKSGRLSNGSDPDRDYMLARPQSLSRNSMQPPPPLHIPSLQYSANSQPQQQQQQQSRALYQNGGLTYPVTSPTSSSSSPSYSASQIRSRR
jgi:exonuclease VII large subunit